MFMLKIVTMNGILNDIVDEGAIVKDYLDEKEVSYHGRTMTLNGENLSGDRLFETFADLGVGDKATIGITAKSDNAANATVIGNALVVTSALKREDLETVAKYRPEAMTAYEGEGDAKTPVFKVSLTDRDAGSIGKYGITFGPTTDADGKARMTIVIADFEKQELIDEIGPAILKLNTLETALEDQLVAIEKDKADAAAAITFA